MTQSLLVLPLIPAAVLYVLLGVTLALVLLALWRGLGGWALRGLALLAGVAALANPSLQREDRLAQSDIVIAVVDQTASNRLADRAEQSRAALEHLQSQINALGNTELRVVALNDAEDDAGSLAMTALTEALAIEPRARLAGVVMITDGRVHDAGLTPPLPAPLHVLLTGTPQDWDRRLVIHDAPAFAIIGEEIRLTLRVEDQGPRPASVAGMVDLTITIGAEAPQSFRVPVGEDLSLPLTLQHGGQNVVQFSLPAAEGELTDRNNAAVVQINGVRDRLRVLLVSGEPHAGERVWRNLLKSDASVDLVHFTILRPPEKQDGVPVSELSLIAFPTRELFVEKIKEFDLIIFDRYRMRGILPNSYLENIVNYVKEGGTVLVAAGPEYGAVDSLWRSPLSEVLPVAPTTRVIEGPFRPQLTDLGRRHPVTEGLEALAPKGGWGHWLRMVEVEPLAGQIVMQGAEGKPLLILNRVEEGRVAVLASDQAWLWGRGYDGGGPQLELLRRLAHWMLKEPELEEEILEGMVKSGTLTITRRSVQDQAPGPLKLTLPDGSTQDIALSQVAPGRYQAQVAAPALGLYRLEQDELSRVVAAGPAAPREFVETLATGDLLAPAVAQLQGGVLHLSDGQPDLRQVGEGRVAAGRGWIGITPREAYVTQDLSARPLLPAWLWLMLMGGLAVAAWLVEGRIRLSRKG